MKPTLAIVGIRGIPNNYGGFETLAEYLVEYLADDFSITVFCSSKDMDSELTEYKGAKLQYVPVSSHGAKGIIYDSLSLWQSAGKFDCILFLGFGGGFVIPLLKRKNKRKIVLNIGGLDWKRDKWDKLSQKVIKKAESLLVKNSYKIISDNIGIQQYLLKEYNKQSILIAYGGDQANHKPITDEYIKQYPFLKSDYAFTVARIQSDNNIEMILNAFLLQDTLPMVMVGNWNNSPYGIQVRRNYADKNRLILLDAIYDREKLDILRSNCTLYIHGHSAGGTNPSLAEAMFLGLPVLAFASGYNEYTSGNKALYFKNAEELSKMVKQYHELPLKVISANLKNIADAEYRWSVIAAKYKQVFLSNIQD